MDKKVFKMNDDTYLELTREELIEKFTPFVIKRAKSWSEYGNKKYYKHSYAFSLEDFIQIGYISIIKAYDRYDISTNNVIFTILYPLVNFDMHKYIRDIAKARSNSCIEEYNKKTISIDDIFYEGTGINNICYKEIIKDDKSDFEEKLIDELDINKYLSILNDDEKNILILYFNNYNQKDIGLIYNKNQVYISRMIKKAFNKIRKHFPKDFSKIVSEDKKEEKTNTIIKNNQKKYSSIKKEEIISFF